MTEKSNKYHKVFTTGCIIIIMIVVTLSMPASLDAGTLQWTVVDTPSHANNIIVSPSEINALAVGADSISLYAVDIPHSKVYKSTNGGARWEDITSLLNNAGASLPVWNIAVAPDNPNIVALVTSIGGLPRNIFVSIDSGNTWQNTNCPAAENISALNISTNFNNYGIVVGTRTGTGNGKVFIYKLSGFGGWADQGFSGDVLAARFSPNFNIDNSLLLASANVSGTYANLGIYDPTANTTNWTSWTPVEITPAGAGTSPKANQIITADLELPVDFLGQAGSQRHIYVSTNDGGATGNTGIFRIDDNYLYQLMPSSGTRMISSISFNGANNTGKLLAGEVKSNAAMATVETWFSPNAGDPCPQASCIIWQKSAKQPTGGAGSGNANAQVLWNPNGIIAFCVTSSADLNTAGWPNGYLTSMTNDESAFSLSVDDGRTWNQTGLIDTTINFLSDVAVTVYSDMVYLSSINTSAGLNSFDSLWRSTGQPGGIIWERILCVLTASNETILRLNPSLSRQSVYLAARGTSDLYESSDSGQTWNKVLPGVNISDFSVTSINETSTIFVLDNNFIRRGEYRNQSWKWGTKTSTSLNSGHSILATARGIVVVGDAGGGAVAYSVDNGMQFNSLPTVPDPGNIHVEIDTRFTNNVVIYAVSDAPGGKVYSWIENATSDWIPMDAPNIGFYGIAHAGTLYCIWSNGGHSGVNRTLNPEALRGPFIEWSNMTAGLANGVLFTREPSAFKISGGIVIWAIDNRPYTSTTGQLWSYYDGLAPVPFSSGQRPNQAFLFQAPTPSLPLKNAIIPVDQNTGELADIEFEWKHPSLAVGYDLWIAIDSEFNKPVIQQSINLKTPSFTKWTLSPPDKAKLEYGETYFWKVRVNRNAYYDRGEGQWSEVMSFTTAAKPSPQDAFESPILLTPPENSKVISRSPSFSWKPLVEATEYEFTLARDPAFQQVILNHKLSNTTLDYQGELDWGRTYYWKVQATKPFIGEPSQISSFSIAEQESQNISNIPSKLANQPLWLWIFLALLIIAILVATIVVISTKRYSSKNIR